VIFLENRVGSESPPNPVRGRLGDVVRPAGRLFAGGNAAHPENASNHVEFSEYRRNCRWPAGCSYREQPSGLSLECGQLFLHRCYSVALPSCSWFPRCGPSQAGCWCGARFWSAQAFNCVRTSVEGQRRRPPSCRSALRK